MLLLRRHARSTGFARSWFYLALAIGFTGLCVWAIFERDWAAAAIAGAMSVIAAVAVPLSRRLTRALLEADGERRRGRV